MGTDTKVSGSKKMKKKRQDIHPTSKIQKLKKSAPKHMCHISPVSEEAL